jgi:hypothetical protein
MRLVVHGVIDFDRLQRDQLEAAVAASRAEERELVMEPRPGDFTLDPGPLDPGPARRPGPNRKQRRQAEKEARRNRKSM